MKEKEDEEGDVNMCKGMEDWLNDEITEATRKTTIEVTKQVTEQVTRETKMSALQANIHAMTMEGLGDDIIRRICMSVFPDMADCIEEQIRKERQLFS